MRDLATADRVEMISVWMSTIAFFFMAALAAVMFYVFKNLDRLNNDVLELQEQIDEMKEARPGATAVS